MNQIRFFRRSFFLLIVFLLCGELEVLSSQTPLSPTSTPSAASLVRPGEVYKQAMHPLDLVRSSLDNWSDAELSALSIAVRVAQQACMKFRPEAYSGEDLYDLARLCSLGQQWKMANTISLQYIASGAETHRTQAYILSMNSLMRLDDMIHAAGTAQTILSKVPYDAEVALAIRYMKSTLELDSPALERSLAEEERPALLAALRSGTTMTAAHSEAQIGAGDLFESGLELAYCYRYDGDASLAAAWVKELDAALDKAPALNAGDQRQVDAARKRYALLGQHLPAIQVQKSFASPTAKVALNPQSAPVTILVLFPDWCVQCRKMMKDLTAFAVANADTPIHAYGLVYSQKPENAATPEPISAEDLSKALQGTSALLVSASAAQTLAATDFPLGIMLNSKGTIRSIGVLPIDAFRNDGFLEKAIRRRVVNNRDPEQK